MLGISFQAKFNEEDAVINVIGRVPCAANELSGKQQPPTATPAITTANWINVIPVYFTGILVSKRLQCFTAGELQIQPASPEE